jgi:hypothetical protein
VLAEVTGRPSSVGLGTSDSSANRSCVQVPFIGEHVQIASSKDRGRGPVITVSGAEWDAFVAATLGAPTSVGVLTAMPVPDGGRVLIGPDGAALRYTAVEWQAFVAGANDGEFSPPARYRDAELTTVRERLGRPGCSASRACVVHPAQTSCAPRRACTACAACAQSARWRDALCRRQDGGEGLLRSPTQGTAGRMGLTVTVRHDESPGSVRSAQPAGGRPGAIGTGVEPARAGAVGAARGRGGRRALPQPGHRAAHPGRPAARPARARRRQRAPTRPRCAR